MKTNDPFTLLRWRLLAVLDNRPDAIAPHLAKKIVVASARILPDMSVNAIEEAITDLEPLEIIAAEYGRIDISDELEEIIQSLQAKLPAPPESAKPNDCRIGINFLYGNIIGGCSGCTAADVADALIAVAQGLQVLDGTPDYISYANGVVDAG